MDQTHWTRLIADAEDFRRLAEEAYVRGNIITHQFWQRLENQKMNEARRAKRRDTNAT